MSDDPYRDKLTDEQYRVCRLAGTESPFSGKYYKHKEDGMYHCVACTQPLFSSETKFESGSGWPSFTDPVNQENVELRQDDSHGMSRTEVLCKNCGSHLGHVFPDGPGPSGNRFCINSVALDFNKKDDQQK